MTQNRKIVRPIGVDTLIWINRPRSAPDLNDYSVFDAEGYMDTSTTRSIIAVFVLALMPIALAHTPTTAASASAQSEHLLSQE